MKHFRPLWSPVNRSWYLEFLMGQMSAFYDWHDFSTRAPRGGVSHQTRADKLWLEIQYAERLRENSFEWVELRHSDFQ